MMVILAKMGVREMRFLSDAKYRELFQNIQESFFVGEIIRDQDGRVNDLRFLEVNEAFARQTGRSAETTLGWRVSKAVPGFPSDLIETFAQVVDTGQPASLETHMPALGNRWYAVRAYALEDQRFVALLFNISLRKQTEEALKVNETLLSTIVETVDQMIWSTQPDGYHDFFNQRWYNYTGVRPGSTDGDGWAQLFHPEDQERITEQWRHSLETGEPYEIEYRLRHHSGQWRWVLGRAHAVRDEAGQIIRWMGSCTDIHEQKELAEKLELASHELSHRIKNIFAVVSALIVLSQREYPEAKPFADELRQRLDALGKAHDYARPHGTSSAPVARPATLLGLIRELLRPYELDGRARILVDGDDGPLNSQTATPLSLAVHELATNAAKYGAFSTPEGQVHVHGHRQDGAYKLCWIERGGPPVQEPAQFGFGSRLVDVSLQKQLEGKLLREWRPEGLKVCLLAPVEKIFAGE
jgi:PAS domain S-box-containing protein